MRYVLATFEPIVHLYAAESEPGAELFSMSSFIPSKLPAYRLGYSSKPPETSYAGMHRFFVKRLFYLLSVHIWSYTWFVFL